MVKPKQSKRTKKDVASVASRSASGRAKAILLNPKVLLVAALVLLAGFGTGWLQYSIAFIGCGKQPVIASKFAAGYSYVVPGEGLYSPTVFSTYFCDMQSAESAGYRPRPGTELFRERMKELLNEN